MNKDKIQNFIARQEITVVEAMQKIDNNSHGILFIVNDREKLIGCLTDGDIRRWIIKTGNLSGTAGEMMNSNPKYLFEKDIDEAQEYMGTNKINCIPILTAEKDITNIVFLYNKTDFEKKDENIALKGIPVIIMAGGKGTRLYPFTKILPKPLIPIGGIPILERILKRFCKYGADEFFLTVNYKKEIIKSYFNELKPEYILHYIEEDIPLGTAGSIRLIKEKFETPVIITNCDILIETDYSKLLEYHKESGNAMTIVSSLKNTTIPYGVLHSSQKGIVSSMEEKPQLSYFINTGMYIINPEYIDRIPENTFFHMTHLAEKLMSEGLQVGMYPISENSFLDMGQFEEMKKMEERVNNGLIE